MSLEALLGPMVAEAKKAQADGQKIQLEILRELREIHRILVSIDSKP